MSETIHLSPFSLPAPRVQAACFWVPEPAFPPGEAAKLLGTNEGYLTSLRKRHPEMHLDERTIEHMSTIFGPSFNEYGEVWVPLAGGGREKEVVCLSHPGLFLHGLFLQTRKAKAFCLLYPEFRLGLAAGTIRAPVEVPKVYADIVGAPLGERVSRIDQAAAEFGKSRRTIYRHIGLLRAGRVDERGMPLKRRPGPPKGHMSALGTRPWMRDFLIECWRGGHLNMAKCWQRLKEEFERQGIQELPPSLHSVRRFLRREPVSRNPSRLRTRAQRKPVATVNRAID